MGMSARITIAGQDDGKRGKIGIGMLGGFAGLFACAYVMGAPEFAEYFPKPVERALTNLRKDIDLAGDSARTTVSGAFQTVTGLVSGR
jgi:hypothetical protein